MEDLDTDTHAPEIPRQETDVEERGARQTEHDRSQGIEHGQDQCVTDEVAANLAVPRSSPEGCLVEDAGLCAVPDHRPKSQLPDDFIQWPFRDQELLGDITETVTEGAEEREQVPLDLVAFADGILRTGCAGDVVAGEENPDTSNAYQDPHYLGNVVSHVQETEGDDDDGDDGEEVDQLRRQDGRVSVSQDGEVVPLHVEEGENDVFPAILEHQTAPAFEAVPVEGEGGVDDIEQDVVEEGLKGRNRGALSDE